MKGSVGKQKMKKRKKSPPKFGKNRVGRHKKNLKIAKMVSGYQNLMKIE